jgi:hypothetical protein
MQFIAPDILDQARGMSISLTAGGFLIGLLLWLTGWWGHRFWIVLVMTVTAGFLGLVNGPVFQVKPLVAGLMLAIAAGVLALSLVRVIAFIAGGVATWIAVRYFAPESWQEPLVCFLAGGLGGLVLFRFWIMALTSFTATLLMGYFGLLLADHFGKVDAVALASQNAVLINSLCAAVSLAGLGAQLWFNRRGKGKSRSKSEEDLFPKPKKSEEAGRWWNIGRGQYRKAG